MPPCGRVTLTASGYVSDGWWFHRYDGPESWVATPAAATTRCRDGTGAVIAKSDGSSYLHVESGKTLTNTSPTATRNLYPFRNDNVPGNGSGSFQVVATLYGP